jgi:hypothetical protein
MMQKIDAAKLVAQAKQFVGSDDLGERIYEPAIEAFTSALDAEGRPEAFHVARLEFQLQHFLLTRAKAAAFFREHPEARKLELKAPVFIVGMPRTGTTLLHNLLAGHPDHFSPPLWQLQTPIREEATYEAWEQASVARSEFVLGMMRQTIPEMAHIHPMNPRWPDECSFLFRPSFATMANAFTYRIPSYSRWLLATDMKPYYEYYRVLLQALLFQNGERAPKARLVLKDPCHLWHLGVLLDVFPDAKVIFLHRHIDEALASFTSLCFMFQRHWSVYKDPSMIGTYCLPLLEEGLGPAVFLRRALGAGRVMDVRYRDLVESPRRTLTAICENIGARTDADAMVAMEKWLSENPQHKDGRHTYTLEEFGYRREEIMERFRAYHEECLGPE